MVQAARLAWLAIAWNVGTIALGSLVRATHSGAGCGRSWPTCQGELVPALGGATTIEFIHRSASGIALLLVAVLAITVFRLTPRGHPARRTAIWAGGGIIAEALIGAAIVLYEWVGRDDSVARVISVPLHLVNTLLLLAALTLTAWFVEGGPPLRGLRGRGWLGLGVVALAVIFATGAVTALADTLYPAAGAGDPATGHFLARLRIVHPLAALATAMAALAAARARGLPPFRLASVLLWLMLAELGLGALNVLTGTPLWLQLLHLLMADVLWIAYVWLAAQVLASESASAAGSSTGARQTNPLHRYP